MPKDTFFNLPEDKRALICKVATDEFAARSFAQASINRIVARSGIAKGSFYQYFENKTDLFLYLVQLAADEKLNYLTPVMQNPEQHDFFTLLRELYLSGLQFAIEHPQYAEISKRLLASKGMPIYDQVIGRNMPSASEFFEPLLESAIAKGEVRANIDARMLAYVITSMSTLVIEYYLEHLGPGYDERMVETIDQFFDVLRHGIGEKNSAEPLRREFSSYAEESQSKGVSP
jgi:AcrR family transcriptional regulator